MDLSDYRVQIDEVDAELLKLFEKRLRIAEGIAVWKKEHGVPVLDETREQQKLAGISSAADEELEPFVQELFRQTMAVSRAYQKTFAEQEE